jgi:putative Ca2+/H+ antiporter (TMEM165/GDT1 family)
MIGSIEINLKLVMLCNLMFVIFGEYFDNKLQVTLVKFQNFFKEFFLIALSHWLVKIVQL